MSFPILKTFALGLSGIIVLSMSRLPTSHRQDGYSIGGQMGSNYVRG